LEYIICPEFFNQRVDMEDAHTEILSLREDRSAAFFGVYDGHGGTIYSSLVKIY
jgi:serine/threonine protein phosphatase PrpC